jgi:hypothetical protein
MDNGMTPDMWDLMMVLKHTETTEIRYKMLGITTPPPNLRTVFATDKGELNLEPIVALVACEVWEKEHDDVDLFAGPYYQVHCISTSLDMNDDHTPDVGCSNWMGMCFEGDESRYESDAKEYLEKMKLKYGLPKEN